MYSVIWVLVVLAVIAIWQLITIRSAYRKLSTLNEYVQFLLFNPQIYEDHREKFLVFVSENSGMSISNQAMASYRAIVDMAAKLEDKILLANVKSRGGGESR